MAERSGARRLFRSHGAFFRFDFVQDQAKTMEPEKCAGWEWASWAALPEPTFASLLEVKRSGIDPFA